jgi:hypothetical protein
MAGIPGFDRTPTGQRLIANLTERFALAVAMCAVTICGACDDMTTINLGRVRSSADTDSRPIMRDGGVSVQYSTQPPGSLWLFGDTSQKNGPQFLSGTTAAIGAAAPGKAPVDLRELPTPPSPPSESLQSPQPFFPVPAGLEAPGSALACGVRGSGSLYPAAWPAGGARVPGSSTLVLVYLQVCVVTKKSFAVERLTLVLFDVARNRLISSSTPFVASPLGAGLAATQVLGSPVFGDDGFLYLFAFSSSDVYVARVPGNPASWGRASNYAWWSRAQGREGAWTHERSAATSLLTGLRVYGISAGNYSNTTLHKYVLLVQTGFRRASFALFEAASLIGPWRAGPTGHVPDACASGAFGCYSLNGHPELSTRELFVYSWYSPGEPEGQGRVNIGALRW